MPRLGLVVREGFSSGTAAARDPSAALARRAGGDLPALHLTRVMGNGGVTLSTSERGFRFQVRGVLCPAWDRPKVPPGPSLSEAWRKGRRFLAALIDAEPKFTT